MSKNNNFYVYAHYRNDTNTVFYIGKGKGARATELIKRNKYWNNIVKKHGFTIKIWADNLTEDQAFAMEKEWIILYGRVDTGEGKLVNLTNGGEGTSGAIISEQTRQKLMGRIISPEHRQKISECGKGNTRSAGRINSSVTRVKISKALVKRALSKNRLPGTCFSKKRNRWVASIFIDGKNVFLGRFKLEMEAHLAYVAKFNELAKKKGSPLFEELKAGLEEAIDYAEGQGD